MRRFLIAWFLVCGCTTESAPTLYSLEPSVVQPDSATLVRVTGDRFETRIINNIETGETDVDQDFVLVLGPADVLQIELEYLDAESLQATLPSGLPPGIYDIEVRAPTGRATLAQALTVAPLPVDLTWGEPTPIMEVNATEFADTDPSATDDLLELYFASLRAGGLGRQDIWVATRTSVDTPWETPVPVVELNTNSTEWGPEVSRDGLSISMTSARGGDIDLYEATRASRTAPWSTPQRVVELSSAGKDSSGAISDSRLHIAFDTDRDPGPQTNMYIANRLTPSEPWNAPTRLDISSNNDEWCPHFASGALELMFASDRGAPGFNGHDIYITSRPDTESPFAAPVLVPELNSTRHDSCPWMSSDRRTLFFSSNRDGEPGIYQATRGQ